MTGTFLSGHHGVRCVEERAGRGQGPWHLLRGSPCPGGRGVPWGSSWPRPVARHGVRRFQGVGLKCARPVARHGFRRVLSLGRLGACKHCGAPRGSSCLLGRSGAFTARGASMGVTRPRGTADRVQGPWLAKGVRKVSRGRALCHGVRRAQGPCLATGFAVPKEPATKTLRARGVPRGWSCARPVACHGVRRLQGAGLQHAAPVARQGVLRVHQEGWARERPVARHGVRHVHWDGWVCASPVARHGVRRVRLDGWVRARPVARHGVLRNRVHWDD